jgi:hypothetical protein
VRFGGSHQDNVHYHPAAPAVLYASNKDQNYWQMVIFGGD